MSRATKMIAAFVIVIFRPLISAILNFFLFDFQKNLKIFRKIPFPVEHKNILSQNKHFLKKIFVHTSVKKKIVGWQLP